MMEKLIKLHSDIKQKYPDVVVLFKQDQQYAAIFEDAAAVSAIGLALTKQTEDLCTFPARLLDEYLVKIVRTGKSVAISENINK